MVRCSHYLVFLLVNLLALVEISRAQTAVEAVDAIKRKPEAELLENDWFVVTFYDVLHVQVDGSLFDIPSSYLTAGVAPLSLTRYTPLHAALAMRKHTLFQAILDTCTKDPDHPAFAPVSPDDLPAELVPPTVPEWRPATFAERQFFSTSGRYHLSMLPLLALPVLTGDTRALALVHGNGHRAGLVDARAAQIDALLAAVEIGSLPAVRSLLSPPLSAPLSLAARAHVVAEQQPLHLAAVVGNVAIAHALVKEFGADVNAQANGDGDTALHIAAHYGHLRLAQELVEVLGALLDVEHGQDFHTPYSLAVHWDRLDVAAYLEGRYAERGLPLPLPPGDDSLGRDLNTPAQTSMVKRQRKRERERAAARGEEPPGPRVRPKSHPRRRTRGGADGPVTELPPLDIDPVAERRGLLERAVMLHTRRAHTRKWEAARAAAETEIAALEARGEDASGVAVPAPADVRLTDEEQQAVLASAPIEDLKKRIEMMEEQERETGVAPTVIVDADGLLSGAGASSADAVAAGAGHSSGVVSAEQFLKSTLCANDKGSKCSAQRAKTELTASAAAKAAATAENKEGSKFLHRLEARQREQQQEQQDRRSQGKDEL